MIAFFDTSAFVPLVLDERTTGSARRLWDRSGRAVATTLLLPEARAAVARAHRQGRIDRDGLVRARTKLADLLDQVELVAVDRELAARAGDLAETHGLRGADAVMLAGAECLAGAGGLLATGDRALCEAAHSLGLHVAEL